MGMPMKRAFLLLLFAACLAAGSPARSAGIFPAKPIRLVCPFAPGSTTDMAARSLSDSAKRYFPQPIDVTNRAGASGVLAAVSVAKARPDGYTMLMARVSCNASVPALDKTTPYKVDDFTFVGITEITPFAVCVRADAPYQSIRELIAAVRAAPGKLAYGTAGALSMLDVVGMMLLDSAGLSISAAVSMPHKGDREALASLLDGRIQFLSGNLPSMMEAIMDGQVRVLAVTTEKRLEALPGIPTIAEAGYPQLTNAVGWSGLSGPRGLPPEVVRAYAGLLQKLKSDPQWIDATVSRGAIPYVLTPEESEAFVREQYDKFTAMGEKLGIIIR